MPSTFFNHNHQLQNWPRRRQTAPSRQATLGAASLRIVCASSSLVRSDLRGYAVAQCGTQPVSAENWTIKRRGLGVLADSQPASSVPTINENRSGNFLRSCVIPALERAD